MIHKGRPAPWVGFESKLPLHTVPIDGSGFLVFVFFDFLKTWLNLEPALTHHTK
jgi:hypothetical protein